MLIKREILPCTAYFTIMVTIAQSATTLEKSEFPVVKYKESVYLLHIKIMDSTSAAL